MKAIKDTVNNLVAALDRFDSVGIIDSFFPMLIFSLSQSDSIGRLQTQKFKQCY